MNKDELVFSKNHIWLLKGENSTGKIGISDYAQEKLGAIVFLNLPDIGEGLSIDEYLGDVESIKTVSDIVSPMDGEVIQINEELLDVPNRINTEPYESWILEARIEKLSDGLMNASDYAKYLEEL